jgi:hypothetical protein
MPYRSALSPQSKQKLNRDPRIIFPQKEVYPLVIAKTAIATTRAPTMGHDSYSALGRLPMEKTLKKTFAVPAILSVVIGSLTFAPAANAVYAPDDWGGDTWHDDPNGEQGGSQP